MHDDPSAGPRHGYYTVRREPRLLSSRQKEHGSRSSYIGEEVFLSLVDPAHAPGVGTAVRGGVTYREAHLALEMICDSRRMVSMEVVEVNPVIDEVNRTADLAVELIMSAMGKRIL